MALKPYYDDGNGIVIYHGDCREILPHLEPVDLVLTDPPYGVDLGSKANNGRERIAYTRLADNDETINEVVKLLSMLIVRTKRMVLTPGV